MAKEQAAPDETKDPAGNTAGNAGLTEETTVNYAKEAQEKEDAEREAFLMKAQNGVVTKPIETPEERKAWRDKEREDAAKEAKKAEAKSPKTEA